MLVLVLNAGSSSQKSCLYNLDESTSDHSPEPLWSAHLDWTVAPGKGLLSVNTSIGYGEVSSPSLSVKSNGIKQKLEITDQETALKLLLDTLIKGETQVLDSLNQIDVVGHRVVHGGAEYSQPVLIDEEVKKAIADLIPLAPNHNPAHLAGIETIATILPQVPQVAVFDTAFHTTIPQAAKIYPLPYKYYEQGIQRYGFHGTSHQYCANRTAQILQQPIESLNNVVGQVRETRTSPTFKIVTCHLGNGCSLAAVKDGVCIDTTMGFSPLEGLMMGTRCGSIDPQIPIYLMQQYGLNVEDLSRIFNKKSGLLGVSGISADLRTVLTAMSNGDRQASLAFDVYIHRLRSFIGAMVASLNGLDVLVFTAGVGENSAIVREKVCEGLSYLGLELDLAKNSANPVDQNINKADSSVKVLVINTQEDLAIAQLARDILSVN